MNQKSRKAPLNQLYQGWGEIPGPTLLVERDLNLGELKGLFQGITNTYFAKY